MMSNAVLVGLFTAGTVAVGVGGYAIHQRMQTTSMPEEVIPTTDAATQAGPAPDPIVQAETPAEMPDPAPATPEVGPTAQSTPATPDLPEAARLPTLDLVRVDANGAAVVAGTGPVAADVVLRLDGQEVATTRTDRTGNFVSLFDVPLGDAPRILTLETVTEDEPPLRAAESVIVAPTFPAPPAMAAAPAGLADEADEPGEEPVEMAAVVPEAPVATAPMEAATSLGDLADTPLPDTNETTAAVAVDRDVTAIPEPGPADVDSIAPDDALASESPLPIDAPTAPASPTRIAAASPETALAPAETAPSQGRQPSALSAVDTTQPPTVPPVPIAAADPALRPASPEPSATPSLATVAEPDVVERPTAPRLFRTGPAGITVVSDGPGALPVANVDLGIDAIAYDAIGDVQLTGTGQRDAQLRIYLNNQPVQTVRVDDTGAWTSPLPNVDSGVYTLRIDEVSPDGTVQSRIETPFQRTAPEIAAQLRRDGATAITVQPGYTLWAISEGYFGDGVQYVQLFEANRDQIRDPDLIYPGQVFALPKE